MPIQAYIIGEPTLIRRGDGWYVEVCDGENIASVGPVTEEMARVTLAEVLADLKVFDENNQ